MKIWKKEFAATYIRDDGIIVLDDGDVPLPKGFVYKKELRSSIIFPPQTRAGDHYHLKRRELFIGFGKGMQIIFENPKTKKIKIFEMDPFKNKGKCVVFLAEPGVPHAVRNTADEPGFLIEFADYHPEKVDYQLNC